MKKIMMVAFAAVLMAGVTLSADAMVKKGKGGMKSGRCGEQMMMDRFEQLGLDAKQKEAVKAIHAKTKKEMIRNNAEVDVAHMELREIVGKEVVDLAAAEAKVKQIEALKAGIKLMHIKAREEVKALLTPEQKKKFAEMHGMGCPDCAGCGSYGHGCDMGGDCGMGMKQRHHGCDMMDRHDKDDDRKHGERHRGGHKH